MYSKLYNLEYEKNEKEVQLKIQGRLLKWNGIFTSTKGVGRKHGAPGKIIQKYLKKNLNVHAPNVSFPF